MDRSGKPVPGEGGVARSRVTKCEALFWGTAKRGNQNPEGVSLNHGGGRSPLAKPARQRVNKQDSAAPLSARSVKSYIRMISVLYSAGQGPFLTLDKMAYFVEQDALSLYFRPETYPFR